MTKVMQEAQPHDQNSHDITGQAIKIIEEMSPHETDGEWLERLTATIAPYIWEWDVRTDNCWMWKDWPERQSLGLPLTDTGIDVVAVRNSDGAHIAIQCKSRKLDDEGRGAQITKKEIDSFASMSSDEMWAERWLVTNGDNPLGTNAMVAVPSSNPIKVINIHSELLNQQRDSDIDTEVCPHCNSASADSARQIRTCMQREAVNVSLGILKDHVNSESGGLPSGEARGKIILPCGTGKTRIALRIVEEISEPGQLAVVLCPSIALVAQIRREFLINSQVGINPLAVCSDQTAGHDSEDQISASDDPTLDKSRVSASEVKGLVTTDADEIAEWIVDGCGGTRLNIIFGTYQSSHKVGEALCKSGVTAQVLIADEAHRTAGLRKVPKFRDRLRDFTVCHDNDRFPVRFRVYQTATPRVYDTGGKRPGNDDWVVRNMDDETVFGVELYRRSYLEAVTNGWLTDYRIIALGVNDKEAYAAANALARETAGGRNKLTTTHFLRGLTLALVLGGATRSDSEDESAAVDSCIGFMNTVAKSKEMTRQRNRSFRDVLERLSVPVSLGVLSHAKGDCHVKFRRCWFTVAAEGCGPVARDL